MMLKDKEIYYIGINANNAICNERFFAGSITMYPTNEIGNVYYSNRFLNNLNSKYCILKYKEFVYDEIQKKKSQNPNAEFMCFNEEIINEFSNEKNFIIPNINAAKILNDKFKIREHLKKHIPILEYNYFNNSDLDYKKISNKIDSDKFVVQARNGSGGDTTYLINNEEDFLKMKLLDEKYCVSKYIKNIPINLTMIISDNNITILPISAQLILLTDNKFKYVGGDFEMATLLTNKIKNQIYEYSIFIGKEIKKMNYAGIVGVDYIITENDEIKFMEINPRFQSSSFLLSLELQKLYNISIAELQYLALTNSKFQNLEYFEIHKSFLNCNKNQAIEIDSDEEIFNGYFEQNYNSIYRKIFNKSIIDYAPFEKIKVKKKL